MSLSLRLMLVLTIFTVGCGKKEESSTTTPTPEATVPGGESLPPGSPPPPDNSAPPESATPTPDPTETASTETPSESIADATSSTVKNVAEVVLPAATNQLDLSYVTDDFSSAIIIHPARFLNSPFVAKLIEAGAPIQEQLDDAKREMGVDPREIAQVMILIDNATAEAAPAMMQGRRERPREFDGQEAPADPEPIERESLEKLDEEVEKAPENNGAADNAPPAIQPVNVFLQPEEAVEEAPMPTVVIRFTKPGNRDALFENFPPLEEKEVDGMKVRAIPDPNVDGVFYFADDQTLILTRSTMLKNVVASKGADSPLGSYLKSIDASNDLIVVADLKPFDAMMQQLAGMLGFFAPPPLASLQTLPTQVDTLAISAGISAENLLRLQLTMKTAEQAEQTGATFAQLLDQARSEYDQNRAQLESAPIPIPEEDRADLLKLADGLVAGLTTNVDSPHVTITLKKPENFIAAVDLLKPAIDQVNNAQERTMRLNTLKQIGLAFHNYHDTHGKFPGAGSNADGDKKGLSWRVHLLPYIDQAPLYEKFNLDEAWDSETNKPLIAQMPDFYKTPGVEEEGKSSFHVFVDESAFSNDEGFGLRNVIDGSSNTILVVEAGADKADVWTKPGGLTPNDDDPLAALGNLANDYFLALLMDGSVRTLSRNVDPEIFKALITKNGGEVIGDY